MTSKTKTKPAKVEYANAHTRTIRRVLGALAADIEKSIREKGVVVEFFQGILATDPPDVLDALCRIMVKHINKHRKYTELDFKTLEEAILALHVAPGGKYRTLVHETDVDVSGEINGQAILVGNLAFADGTKITLFNKFVSKPFYQYGWREE